MELRIRQRRLNFLEFAEQLEVFARENGEVGTLSFRHVQRLCAGKFAPLQLRAATARLLEKYFDESVEELLSAPAASVSAVELIDRQPSDGKSSPAESGEVSGQVREGFVGVDGSGEKRDNVDRREFIGSATGAALSVATAFSSTLSSRATELDCRHLVDRTARLRRLDNFLGGRDTYDLFASELASTVNYVRKVSCTPKVRSTLVGVVSEQAQLAGWAAFDAGLHDEAKRHYGKSLKAAKEAKNFPLAGNALAFLAYQEVSTRGPNIRLAEASYAAAEKDATPRVLALLLERKAWTYAVSGDAKATERALEEAKIALRTESDRPEPDWVFWVDENEIEIMAGRCWAELRRPIRAVSSLESALSRFDDTHARDKALYMTSLAHALIDGKEIDRAALITQECMRLAQGVGSVRPRIRINGVVNRLREFRGATAVARVLEQAQA